MGGAPTWTVYDPVRGRYFQIGWLAFRLLNYWRLGDPDAVLQAAIQGTTLEADDNDVKEMLLFLRSNNLLSGDASGQKESYLAQVKAAKMSWGKWLLHNYLFIRIPLLRPDAFLAKTWPWVRPLFTPQCLLFVMALGLLGLLLAARRWDEFLATFMHFFSLEGAILLACTITFTNVLHEFGHAYMAKRFGCRVHTIGIAFVVLFPVFYSDVTDAWRLVSRQQRLLIGAAGMLVELALAMIATLLWSFLPDGELRSVAFMLATVTWITTLVINLNPLMKFDGYFLLSDFLGVVNLQDRAFALARWRLREWMFGFADPVPELLPRRHYLIMLVWAYATWLWRFILFLGIALIVYHAFFKALGIFLMLVEIAWFILRPLNKEFAEWWQRREHIKLNRQTVLTVLALSGGLWLLATPWQSRVSLPATLEAADFALLFPPTKARIKEVHVKPGDNIHIGQWLYTLEAPDLDHAIAMSLRQLELLQRLIQRQAASSATLEQLGVLESQLSTELANMRGYQERRERLKVVSPIAGVVRDVPKGLSPGLWINEDFPLGRIIDPARIRLRAYVKGEDLDRILPNAKADFYPEDPLKTALKMHVVKVEQLGISALDNPYLASTTGGPIAVREDHNQSAVPLQPLYRVYLAPDDPQLAMRIMDQITRGTVQVDAEAVSPLVRFWRFTAGVIIRESGF